MSTGPWGRGYCGQAWDHGALSFDGRTEVSPRPLGWLSLPLPTVGPRSCSSQVELGGAHLPKVPGLF